MAGPIAASQAREESHGSSVPAISAKTGVAPAYRTAFAVATKVSDGTITSSPGPRPAARHIRCRAAVPLETAQACGTPTYSANAASNSDVRGPMLSQPERYVAATDSMSASVTRTSASGTFQAVIL